MFVASAAGSAGIISCSKLKFSGFMVFKKSPAFYTVLKIYSGSFTVVVLNASEPVDITSHT